MVDIRIPSQEVAVDRAGVTAAVPEPETLVPMFAGLAGIGMGARRRASRM
jgi:hypothetical protein